MERIQKMGATSRKQTTVRMMANTYSTNNSNSEKKYDNRGHRPQQYRVYRVNFYAIHTPRVYLLGRTFSFNFRFEHIIIS